MATTKEFETVFDIEPTGALIYEKDGRKEAIEAWNRRKVCTWCTSMASEKTYSNEDPVAITLTVAEWETVLHWLQYGVDYHHCKRDETLGNCKDRQMAAQLAAKHEAGAEQAETVWKIIEAAIMEDSTNETTES